MKSESTDIAAHLVFVLMDRDCLYRPTCGCGWMGNGYDDHEKALVEAAEHGEVVS